MAKQYDILVKLLLLGDSGVGKTCMICRFAEDTFQKRAVSTIGIDFKMKSMDIDGKRVRVQLWDTAGQERYETLTKSYYRRAQGAFLVYDITNESTFLHLSKWLDYLRDYATNETDLMLLANKCDAEDARKVDTDRGAKLAQELNIPFFETSAKESENVEKAFIEMVRNVINHNKHLYDGIRLDRQDSEVEFVSELERSSSRKSASGCCG